MSRYSQTMARVPRVYVLPRCKVELYQTASDGELGALVWTALQMDNVRIGERFDEDVRNYTGIPYEETRHLGTRHDITFDAIWNVSSRLVRNTEYILAITWIDAAFDVARGGWVRRFYAGVTTSSREISSRDSNEFGSSNTLKAKYFNETTGDGQPSATAPGQEIC